MKTTDLDKFRKRLQDMDTRLRGDTEALENQARQGTGGESGGNLSDTPMHMADLGTAAYMQELNATLLENEERIEAQVRAALERIDAGTFGTCQQCGKPIAGERLDALPYTRHCIHCAEAIQAGQSPVNLNEGRPDSAADTMNPHDDPDAADLWPDAPQTLTGLEGGATDNEAQGDRHAAGLPGGGSAIGGLAGTNIAGGDPLGANLGSAMGSSQFDAELAEDASTARAATDRSRLKRDPDAPDDTPPPPRGEGD